VSFFLVLVSYLPAYPFSFYHLPLLYLHSCHCFPCYLYSPLFLLASLHFIIILLLLQSIWGRRSYNKNPFFFLLFL
jgi:hypothetical protein